MIACVQMIIARPLRPPKSCQIGAARAAENLVRLVAPSGRCGINHCRHRTAAGCALICLSFCLEIWELIATRLQSASLSIYELGAFIHASVFFFYMCNTLNQQDLLPAGHQVCSSCVICTACGPCCRPCCSCNSQYKIHNLVPK